MKEKRWSIAFSSALAGALLVESYHGLKSMIGFELWDIIFWGVIIIIALRTYFHAKSAEKLLMVGNDLWYEPVFGRMLWAIIPPLAILASIIITGIALIGADVDVKTYLMFIDLILVPLGWVGIFRLTSSNLAKYNGSYFHALTNGVFI
jgi:hypothetical protein